MPCLLVVLALAVPRVLIAGLWLFTHWFNGLFDTLLWPVLGFIFLPTTLFWYTAVQHWYGGEWSVVPVIGLVLALMIDVSPAGGAKEAD
ncbi:MAG: hypothetical protein GVY35_04755 [Bacteroidetes bacterium]|jgi:hypothetical protein|nr:hypothetical protein [Bacteroidota bacterium]